VAESNEPKCAFCSLPSSKVQKLVRGIGEVHICNSCVAEAFDIVEESIAEEAKETGKKKIDKPNPRQIIEHLNNYVIGQEQAKKILAVSVYNHYKRVGKLTKHDLGKSNVLLVGPTGSGKTLLAETIAKFLEVPFAVADATAMTEAGYVGDDVESVLVRLLQNSGGDIEKAERGIVYIDEIDKIAAQDTRGRDVSGEGVQQGLLKMLEGSIVSINPNGGKRSSQGQEVQINTKNILFICGGAFSGITDPNKAEKTLGINASFDKKEVEIKLLKHKDLVKYGMIPEFVGRFALLAQLETLKTPDLVKILTEPKNAVTKQYRELLLLDGVELTFTQEFLDEVATRAATEGTGARGLRAIVEPLLIDIMVAAPDGESKTIEINIDIFKKEEKK
jgi:ATP-dependent Clp protease ATP-binding subunit ClpX